MDYIVLSTVIVLNTALFLVIGAYGKKQRFNSFLFTAFTAVATIIFFAFYNKFTFAFDLNTTVYALINAGLYIAGMVANSQAVKHGSVALTSMIASFALLLPTVFGIVYWKEEAGLPFYLGLMLFCVSLILMKAERRPEKSHESSPESTVKKKNALLWSIAAAVLFFSNGIASIVTAIHQKSGGASFRGEYMILSMSIVLAANLAVAFFQLRGKMPSYLKNASLYGIGYGLLNSGIRLGVMILTTNGVINQSVFYPLISIAVMVLVFIFSVIFFKERFRPLQYVGAALGIASVVLLQV